MLQAILTSAMSITHGEVKIERESEGKSVKHEGQGK